MNRRTIDLIFSIGGLLLAGLLLVLGLVLKDQASFARNYVHDQLGQQKITFSPVSALTDDEKKVGCLTKNAGKDLLTGKQAECYANAYIGDHLKGINEGKTYSQTSGEARAARTAAKEALTKNPNDPAAKALDAKATDLEGKVQTLFRGETLRGLLLTSFGFSIFGERADTAGTLAYAAAVVLLLAGLAGLVHASRARA
jgi:hypothetical protein